MSGKLPGQQRIDEFVPYQTPIRQTAHRRFSKTAQPFVTGYPDAKRQSEAMLLFDEDFVRKKTAQGLLEKPAQFEALHLVAGGQLQ